MHSSMFYFNNYVSKLRKFQMICKVSQYHGSSHLDATFEAKLWVMFGLIHIPNSVSLDKSNTLFYLFFAFIFVRDILCLKLNVAAALVRSSAG